VTDLVLSFHPLDCMTCPKAGACDLQRYAGDLKIQESTFGRKSFNYPLNDRSPFITIDNNYCILCGRCVRVCKDNAIEGQKVQPYKGGFKPYRIRQQRCTHCGECIKVCPENAVAIVEKDRETGTVEPVRTLVCTCDVRANALGGLPACSLHANMPAEEAVAKVAG